MEGLFAMKIRNPILLLSAAVLLAAMSLLTACSSDERKSARSKENKYPKLTNYTLKLDIISTRGNYRRGEANPVVRFSLKNAGANQLSIHEWKMHEQENIRVLYAECPEAGQATRIPENQWKESERNLLKTEVPRYPLELAPNNGVLVDVPLNFIRNASRSGRYAIRGELDLDSVSAKSAPIEIVVK